MSKTKTKLPTVNDIPTETQAELLSVQIEELTVTVPVVNLIVGYVTNRCDVYAMSELQRTNLRRLQNGLIAGNATLANGKEVKNGQDAVKWFLESM